jgi:hypothetical protein
MAYGRLEIYYPDGKIETYMLSEQTVSIGRAEGNTIALNSDTISRYHFSIEQIDAQTITITDLDSQNGTSVDGMLLTGNERTSLGAVEEIQAGALRIIFRKVDDSPTMPMTPIDDTARIEREEADVAIEFDTTSIDVWPASSSSSEISITNTASETRRFTIQVSGLPSDWLRLTRSEVELLANETAYVLVHIKPPRRPTTTPNAYMLTIEVAPLERPDLALQASLDVRVQGYRGFGMAIAPQPDPDDPVSVFLHNQGSVPLDLRLTATNPHDALVFDLPSAPLTLTAGQRMRVDMNIAAKSPPFTGTPMVYPFRVIAKSDDAAGFMTVTESRVSIAPRFALWTVVSGAGIAVSVVLIALLAFFGVLNPPQLALDDLRVNATQIARGDDLIIRFVPQDIATLRLLADDAVIYDDIDGTTETVALSTQQLATGTYTMTLVGINGGERITEQFDLTVYEPVRIESFSITPDILVRNAVNNLQLAWDVPGAVFVRITGLSDFTNNLLQASTEYPAQHRLEGIGGIPTESLEITLYAEDEVGNPIAQTTNLQVIDPQCTATEDVTVREGPDGRYQQVGAVPAGASVVVNAQDADAGWLRLALDGNIDGWGRREAFTCADYFAVINLRTETNVPPLPTIVPTLAPTATITPPPATDDLD